MSQTRARQSGTPITQGIFSTGLLPPRSDRLPLCRILASCRHFRKSVIPTSSPTLSSQPTITRDIPERRRRPSRHGHTPVTDNPHAQQNRRYEKMESLVCHGAAGRFAVLCSLDETPQADAFPPAAAHPPKPQWPPLPNPLPFLRATEFDSAPRPTSPSPPVHHRHSSIHSSMSRNADVIIACRWSLSIVEHT